MGLPGALFSPGSKDKKKSIPRKCLLLQEMKAPKKFLIFSRNKAFLIFQEILYISEKELSYASENPKNLSEIKK